VIGLVVGGIMVCRCVMEVPTDAPLTEDYALNYFRDIVAGIEYRTYIVATVSW